MDGAKNGLAGSGELAEEGDNKVRALSIKTRSWLVEEKQCAEGDPSFSTDSPSESGKTYGLLTSSTPMVTRFLCSTPKPAPGFPINASSMSCSSSSSMMTSTYASLS